MRNHIIIKGLVQGVGFRPFIYRMAAKHNLSGWVKNAIDGVHIEVEGKLISIDAFVLSLQRDKPVQAKIHAITRQSIPEKHEYGFSIVNSDCLSTDVPLIAPDIATCAVCRSEVNDFANRRFQYPFTNCTNCGPRYTIIRQAPYDRQMTSMSAYTMCDACQAEYNDPSDRRFHAQPNACPVCGPYYYLTDAKGKPVQSADKNNVFNKTRELVRSGSIIAIKGIGGFHFACDARNEAAVATLRQRKIREDKPFAVLAGSVGMVKALCPMTLSEEELLTGPIRPILLLDKGDGYDLALGVAPNNPRIGVMLPYTPVQDLLLGPEDIWVMTSGNSSDEPIAFENQDALDSLAHIADYFLFHDRDICRRADDSVVRVFRKESYILRRGRGYTPLPIKLEFAMVPVLACGGELKNTFCLTHGQQAFVSAHIGDLEDLSTYQYYIDSIQHYQALLHINPEVVAFDLHPEYLSTKYAKTIALPQISIQHHHAHIVSAMAEHSLSEPVIGVAYDGAGYGLDGAIWGGEFLLTDYRNFSRAAYCQYLPLPGGAKAIKQPWRLAAWILYELFGEPFIDKQFPFTQALPPEWPIVIKAAAQGVNAPLTSSMGRLFDAAAALLSPRQSISYEGQAAIELEMAAEMRKGSILPYEIVEGTPRRLNLLPAFAALTYALQAGEEDIGYLAACFHTTVAYATFDMLRRIRSDTAIRKVVLSGGVFQNLRLLSELTDLLDEDQFTVYHHCQIPTNDGGLSLGQAVIANARCK